MDEHNLVEKAIKVLQSADAIARRRGQETQPEHVVLALFEVRHSIASKHLRGRMHIKRQMLEQLVEQLVSKQSRLSRLLDCAQNEAESLKHGYVGTEHLLIAALKDPEIRDFFSAHAIDSDLGIRDLLRMLGVI